MTVFSMVFLSFTGDFLLFIGRNSRVNVSEFTMDLVNVRSSNSGTLFPGAHIPMTLLGIFSHDGLSGDTP